MLQMLTVTVFCKQYSTAMGQLTWWSGEENPQSPEQCSLYTSISVVAKVMFSFPSLKMFLKYVHAPLCIFYFKFIGNFAEVLFGLILLVLEIEKQTCYDI